MKSTELDMNQYKWMPNMTKLFEKQKEDYRVIKKQREMTSLDFKTPTQCHNSGRIEKLRWYPYKKIRFSNVVKKQPEKAF